MVPTFLRDRYPDMSDFERSISCRLPVSLWRRGFAVLRIYLRDAWTAGSGSIAKTRRIMACIGFAGAAVMLAISTNRTDAVFVMLLIGMASFFNDLVMPGAWAACMDVGGKYAGTVSGSMNMMGNLAGFVAPTVGGMMRDANTDWNVFLLSMAGVYLLWACCAGPSSIR